MVFAILPSFLLNPSTIQTTANADSIDFQEPEPKTSQFIPRNIRVAIYNEPNITLPSYGSGGLKNNLTDTIAILTNAGYQVTNITTQEIYDHKLKTADYDIFVMVDNLPKTNITNYVKEYWLGGGGLLSFDSAINFLCYAGVLPPESVGDNGIITYWTYLSGTNEIFQRHPVTKNYSSGELFTTIGSRGTFDWAVLQTTSIASDLVRIATIDGSPNDVTVLGFDPSNGGGRVVQMPWTDGRISGSMSDLVSDAVDWLCPRPKGRILFDLAHAPYYGIDSWDSIAGYTPRFETLRDSLVNRSYTIDKWHSGNLTQSTLALYDLLIITAPDINFTSSEVSAVTNWINTGGSLLILGIRGAFTTEVKNINYLLSSFDLKINTTNSGSSVVNYINDHPTVEGCTVLDCSFSAPGLIIYEGSATPIWGNDANNMIIGAQEYGEGRVILSGDLFFLRDPEINNDNNLQYAINMVNWLTAADAEVVIFVQDQSASSPNDNIYTGPVATALNELGYSFYLTFTEEYLNLSLADSSYKLVIIDNTIYTIMDTVGESLLNFIKSGGYLILNTWTYRFATFNYLWSYLGFSYAGNYILASPPIVNIWNPTHAIFSTPAAYGATTIESSLNFAVTDYTNLTLYGNATAIAGLTLTTDENGAAIILGANGHAITNALHLTEYYDDTDDSTYPDGLEIWTNEIAFMLYQSLSIQINSPLASDAFSTSAPNYNISTDGIFLDNTWYTLNDGTEYPVASNAGTINQAAWDALPEGTVSLKFYVEDDIGQEKYQEVTILKDSLDPTIAIANPIADQSFASTAPLFIVGIHDTNLDKMWYTLGSNTTKHFFTTNGSIVQSAWDLLAQGTLPITFYANDTIGNENSASVNVRKSISSGGIPGYNSYIIISLVGIISIIIIKRRFKK